MRSLHVQYVLRAMVLQKMAGLEFGDGPAATILERSINTPLHHTSVSLSNRMLQNQGSELYGRELIPGFSGTVAEDVLKIPTEEEFSEQVAAGTAPTYTHRASTAGQEDKSKGKRSAKVLSLLAKMATTGPGGLTQTDEYQFPAGSEPRERAIRTNTDISFNRVDNSTQGETSTTAPTAFKGAYDQNQAYQALQPRNTTPTLATAPTRRETTYDRSSADHPGRRSDEMFDSLEHQDQMIPERVIQASATPWSDDYVGQSVPDGGISPNIVSQGLDDPRGKSTARAWREHNSYSTELDIPETASPGPQVF